MTGFVVLGHSGRSAKGSDIVCAGVSALTDTTVLAMERLLGLEARVEAGEGRLTCDLPEDLAPDLAEKTGLLIDAMLLGLQEIARAYPDRLTVR